MRRLATFGLISALAAMVVIAIFAYRTIDALVDTASQVEHGRQIIDALDTVLLSATSAGRARRTYGFTHADSELTRVTDSVSAAYDALARARALTSGSPSQRRKIETLEPMLAARFADIAALVDAERAQGHDDAREEEAARRATAGMRGLAAVVEEVNGDERRQLAEHQARVERDAALARVIALAGTGASVAIIVLAFAGLRRENARRMRSEEALAGTTRFVDSIIEHIPAMIFVKEARDLRFERINRAGEELLGIPRAELLGKNDHDFFPKQQAEFFQARDREVLGSGAVLQIPEEPIDTKSGRRWLHTQKVALPGADGKPRYLLGISQDITEAKRSAEALRGAMAAAETANRELEAFSYSVAHDLRAPLLSIDGFSLALLEDYGEKLDEGGRDYLQRVRASTKRMGELIDGLLALSRVVRVDLQVEEVDLSALAAVATADLRQANPERDVQVKIEPALRARGDSRLLRVVFDNLVGNAFKFTSRRPGGATIEVGSRAEAGEQVYFVRDNGAGFDTRYASRLFGAFQRLHDQREFPGTGIGLATVQRVIARHGGRIWAQGQPGEGATFLFTLTKG